MYSFVFLLFFLIAKFTCQIVDSVKHEEHGTNTNKFEYLNNRQSRSEYKCIDIPKSLKICQNLPYKRMKMPNMFGDDNINVIVEKLQSWQLLMVKPCHPHARLLLCAIIAPVCVDYKLLPCQSLCYSVKQSCEHVMNSFGFKWPDNFKCQYMPPDNALCLYAPPVNLAQKTSECKTCLTSNSKTIYELIRTIICGASFENPSDYIAYIAKNSQLIKQISHEPLNQYSNFYYSDKIVYAKLLDKKNSCTCHKHFVENTINPKLSYFMIVKGISMKGNGITIFQIQDLIPIKKHTRLLFYGLNLRKFLRKIRKINVYTKKHKRKYVKC
ncbi:hypothetical protein A3Q56_02934 [Intoshia linei]|uniref:FZ domain-containing protein n=1 Tax=Intoshia linei TaxID=1819745 RepID=A0A177B5E3_9BILA|nr:hypothetical protein A3Q56_02934 [Intoshia linei]